jgi:hypothetical protein
VKHTFGTGGFLDKESYDTEVVCSQCLLAPQPAGPAQTEGSPKVVQSVEVVKKSTPAAEAEPAEAEAAEAEPAEAEAQAAPAPAQPKGPAPKSTEDSRNLLTKFAESKKTGVGPVPPGTATFYGPGGCVATYKSSTGTCLMQTRCEGQNITEYNFGLDCMDAEGVTSRHMFGKNSFDPKETFDTLVECDKCLALDQTPKQQVGDLAAHVLSLQHEMDSIKDDLKVIKDHLQPKEEAAADTEETEETEEGDGEAEASEDEAASLAATASEDTSDDEDAAAVAATESAEDADAETESAEDADEAAEDEVPVKHVKHTLLRKSRPVVHHKAARRKTLRHARRAAPESDELDLDTL